MFETKLCAHGTTFSVREWFTTTKET
jgi:hypothetical protein